MPNNEALNELRSAIDEIDSQLLPLIEKRMAVVDKVAHIKQVGNLPIYDEDREAQIIKKVESQADNESKGDVSLLMRTILSLSKRRQRKSLYSEEMTMLPPPRIPVTKDIKCAYQGVPGSWSEQALMKLYPSAKRESVEYFEDVFLAIKEKRVDYGVVALENSHTGAIGETYDLLRKYGCYIVGQTWIDIRQCLVAPKGCKLHDIRRILSHPEAFKQCSNYLRNKPWNLTSCRNTAVAAQMVAESTDGDAAAIASRLAAERHDLEIIAPDIMDSISNRTSFVVIALEPEYTNNSDRVSISFSTAHRSGALCEILVPFMVHGTNLVRIESRPGTTGNYRFFAELDGNIMNADTLEAIKQAAIASEYFEVIGCYNSL